MIPYSTQSISEEDITSVCDTLRSAYLTQGPKVEAFQDALRDYCGVQHCLAVSNATAALHLACLALGIGPGDTVLTSPISFVSSANCALFCGAQVDFVDIDEKTFCLSPIKLEEKLKTLQAQGRSVKAVIPVHFGGHSCDMERIHQLAVQYQFRVIEDASHALGGQYQGKPVGSCQYSDITVLSFHPVKMITTGEGGALLTNNPEWIEKAKQFACHGIVRDQRHFQDFKEEDWFGPWAYQQNSLGYNYRITDIQCALGISQLARLDHWVQERNRRAEYYQTQLDSSNVEWQQVDSQCLNSYHLFVVLFNCSAQRMRAYKALREQGVGVNVHYIPIHTQPYYLEQGHALGDYPQAENYYRRTLSVPLYPSLEFKKISQICDDIMRLCHD